MCAEIVALRAHRKQGQSRLAYLGRKSNLTGDEQAEKTRKEGELTGLQVKIANLYHKVKSTAAADLHELAAVAADDYLITTAAIDGAKTNRAAALNEAEHMLLE